MIYPINPADFAAVVTLANHVHGAGYLTEKALADMVQQGIKQQLSACFLAKIAQRVVGYRISFAAGQWQPDKWCSPSAWPVAIEDMAYFKSVAVHPDMQAQGIGQALLQRSIQVLKQQGAKAGLAHLWCQSPHNSAVRYFSKAGGQLINRHENRWQHLSAQGYHCPRCGKVCCCSAAEMVLQFTE